MTRLMWSFAFTSVLYSLTFVAPAQAELTPYVSYTVPGLSNPIQQIDLADVDGDGSAEVLAFDAAEFVLYSPVADSTYFNISLDSIVTSMDLTNCMEERDDARILIADVNRDSLLDALILVGLLCDPGNPYTSSPVTHYVLAFIDDVTSGTEPVAALEMEFQSALGIGMLDAVDLDEDGYSNLVLSVDSSEFWEYFPSLAWDYSFGKTLIYHSFPDSLISQVEAVLLSVWPVTSSGGNPILVADDKDWFWQDYTGIGPEATTTEGVTLLSSGGEILSHREREAFAVCVDDWQGAIWTSLLQPHWVGDIITTTPELEVLCTFYAHQESHNCDTTERALVALEITATDSLRELWSVNNGEQSYYGFVAHASFPDQFFAFAGNTLMRFDATDGSLIKHYPPFPPGYKTWVYPYGDSVPYLMNVAGQTVTYYTFDEVTDVETSPTSTLPSSFTLGQPYPNPFNPSVTLPITLPYKGHLQVEVFNILGQPVSVIFEGKAGPGEMNVVWDATDVSSGVYFFKVVFNDLPKTVSAILVK
jgi:hypothetical protein